MHSKYLPTESTSESQIKDIESAYLNSNQQKQEEDAFARTNQNGPYFGRLDTVMTVVDPSGEKSAPLYRRFYFSKGRTGTVKQTSKINEIPWQYYSGTLDITASLPFGSAMVQVIHYLDSGDVIDWRSPVASLYYQRDASLTTSIDDKLLERYTPVGTTFAPSPDIHQTKTKFLGYNYQKLLAREFPKKGIFSDVFVLGGKANASLPDSNLAEAVQRNMESTEVNEIISSITPEQDTIIRLSPSKSFIFQGCAGSGKTAVLYHRISTLKYNYPEVANSLVSITPNEQLKAALIPMLQNLGIASEDYVFTLEEFYERTLHDYFPKITATFDDSLLNEAFPGLGEGLFAVCDAAYANLKQSLLEEIQNDFSDPGFILQPEIDNTKTLASNFKGALQSLESNQKQAELCRENKTQKLAALSLAVPDVTTLLKILAEERSVIQKEADLYPFVSNPYPDKPLFQEGSSRAKESVILSSENVLRGHLDNLASLIGYCRDVLNYSETNYSSPFASLVSLFSLLKALAPADPQGRLLSRKYRLSTDECDRRLNPYRSEIVTEETKKMAFAAGHEKETLSSFVFEVAHAIQEAQADYEKVYEKSSSMIEKGLLALPVLKEKYEGFISGDSLLARALPFFKDLDTTDEAFAHKDFSLLLQTRLGMLYLAYLIHGNPLHEKKSYLIDEAQEVSLSDLKLLNILAHGQAHFELYGDYRQTLSPNGRANWFDIQRAYPIEYHDSKNNYRNAKAITDYVNQECGTKMVAKGPEGGSVETIAPQDVATKLVHLISLGKRIVLIGKNKESIVKLAHVDPSSQAIKVLTPLEAKGLEFNFGFVFTDGLSSNELYVALTRALGKLFVVKKEESFFKRLFRFGR